MKFGGFPNLKSDRLLERGLRCTGRARLDRQSTCCFVGSGASRVRLRVVYRRPAPLAMYLTHRDVGHQLDRDRDALSRLGEEALRRLAKRPPGVLPDARSRLAQDSRSSSSLPGSDSVYRDPRGGDSGSDSPTPVTRARSAADAPAAHRPCAPNCYPAFGRTRKLTVNAVLDHCPVHRAAGDEPFVAEGLGQTDAGYDEIAVPPTNPRSLRPRLRGAPHRFCEAPFGCGHCSRHQSQRATVLPEWQGGVASAFVRQEAAEFGYQPQPLTQRCAVSMPHSTGLLPALRTNLLGGLSLSSDQLFAGLWNE